MTKTVEVLVNYNLSPTQMVARGRYDHAVDVSQSDLLILGEGEKTVRLKLVRIERSLTRGEVIEYLKWTGFRPARFEELCAWGILYLQEPAQGTVLAIGTETTRRDGYFTASIARYGKERIFCLLQADVHQWGENAVFLAAEDLSDAYTEENAS